MSWNNRENTQLSQCVHLKNGLFDTVRFEQHIRQLVATASTVVCGSVHLDVLMC